MGIAEILLLGVSLAMDAFAVSVTNGLSENKMKTGKIVLVAGAFGLFQGIMPAIGGLLASIFCEAIKVIQPFLSLAILGFIGGKMIFDAIKEMREHAKEKTAARENAHGPACDNGADFQELSEEKKTKEAKKITLGVILMQAVATSIDALAVGVTLSAQEAAGLLAWPMLVCCAVIAAITFAICIVGVILGKTTSGLFSDKATLVGGIILVLIAIKIFAEGMITLLC